jgi:hypothetical protein
MSNFETLIPGLLVSLKTTLTGNVSYKTRDLVPTESAPEGGIVQQWDTLKTVADAAEHELAKKVRSKARSSVAGVCVASAFGLLCPESKKRELDDAIRDAQRLATEFNASAKLTRVGVFVITGKVASDDEQAIRAINSEMAELIEGMQKGVANLDPAAIREAANKARDIALMLSPATQERVGAAIELARKEARRLVKAGEVAGVAVDQSVVAALAHSRTAFLEIDTVQGDVAAPVQQAASLELSAPDSAFTPEQLAEMDATAADFAASRDAQMAETAAPVLDVVDAEFTEVDAPAPVATPAIETDNLNESAFAELFADEETETEGD